MQAHSSLLGQQVAQRLRVAGRCRVQRGGQQGAQALLLALMQQLGKSLPCLGQAPQAVGVVQCQQVLTGKVLQYAAHVCKVQPGGHFLRPLRGRQAGNAVNGPVAARMLRQGRLAWSCTKPG